MTTRKSAVSSRNTAASTPDMFRKSSDEPEIEPVRREKRTFHLDSDVVILLGKIQFDELQQTGKKPNLSDLVGEGIRLLSETRNSVTAK